MASTFYSESERKLCAKVFPEIIKNVIRPQNSFSNDFPEEMREKVTKYANRMKAHLIDMAGIRATKNSGPFNALSTRNLEERWRSAGYW